VKRTLLTTATLLATVAAMVFATQCGNDAASGDGEATGGGGDDQAKAGDGETGGGGDTAKTPEPAAPAGKGTIKGKVAFTGTAPTPAPINRDSDPVCKATPRNAEDVLVENGALRNVIVRISKGVRTPVAGSGSIEINQTECMYTPRVSAISAGQKIAVKNGDQTMHNVHTYPPEGESGLNRAQVPGSNAIEVEYTTHGAVVAFKCDVHPWMAAHVSVTNHPYFAVTGADGTFNIADVPAGSYTLEAWHEKFGSKTADITVAADGTVETNFSYAGTEQPAG